MIGADSRTAAVIVGFHPERESITDLLEALEGQVGKIILIDNTPGSAPAHVALIEEIGSRYKRLEIYRPGSNLGIAKAMNEGISRAIEAGCDFVYLSDQDSKPDEDMIRGLLDCYSRLAEQGERVGCICPAYYDATTGMLFNFQADVPGKLFYKSVPAEKARPYLELVTTISSGSLIPCRVLQQVGLMRDTLFIDYVDTEWCHRARYKAFKIIGTSEVLLHHRLGDNAFRIWVFGWRLHNLYSPVRIYYRFRNYILVSRLPHVPLRWSLRASWYWLGNLYAYTVFAPRRMRNIKAISLGLLDGILGRSGRCRHNL